MCVPILFEMFYVIASFNITVEYRKILKANKRRYLKGLRPQSVTR